MCFARMRPTRTRRHRPASRGWREGASSSQYVAGRLRALLGSCCAGLVHHFTWRRSSGLPRVVGRRVPAHVFLAFASGVFCCWARVGLIATIRGMKRQGFEVTALIFAATLMGQVSGSGVKPVRKSTAEKVDSWRLGYGVKSQSMGNCGRHRRALAICHVLPRFLSFARSGCAHERADWGFN